MRVPVTLAAASLILILVASATACSSAPGTAGTPTSLAGTAAAQATVAAAGSSGPVHVCSLLSAARASAIVGVRYSSATESSGGSTCTYATTAAPIPLSINLQQGAGATEWKAELGIIREGAGAAPVTLNGVGDRAAGGGNEFGAQDGSYIIDILGGDPVVASNGYPKSAELARAIITALH